MLLSYYMFCYWINFSIGSPYNLRRNQINATGKSLRILLYGEFCLYNHISNIETLLRHNLTTCPKWNQTTRSELKCLSQTWGKRRGWIERRELRDGEGAGGMECCNKVIHRPRRISTPTTNYTSNTCTVKWCVMMSTQRERWWLSDKGPPTTCNNEYLSLHNS